MKSLSTIALSLSLAFAAGPLFAADPPARQLTPQQQRMKDCNAQAGDRKGDERKTFMSSCLKGETAAKAMTPQERMKACNADANTKHLTGDARKTYMSTCLKSESAGAGAH